ncbi:hypothetical protein PLEOSDRAFT_1107144 [Pleurotus ostreatus PC15]|uniref:Uncharacterized protein n=1 Tax=Pleurotus ostreatus (strain PC15) TaxID=1137138 RepID=A0A067NKU8_PLEO1|nr:hypothetical protein PLEOSDRAFT_1107144 [Pleurotus ostreatus PC15]
MVLVYKDPSVVDTRMAAIFEETFAKLQKLRMDSRCLPDGRIGDNCLYLNDTCNYAVARIWAQPALGDVRSMIPWPYRGEDPKFKPTHHVIQFPRTPTEWGLPLADLIVHFSDYLTVTLSEPFGEDYNTCVYSFSLLPWVRERVFSAAALKCHGEPMSKASLMRHIAVNMLRALREKRPDMTGPQVFRQLINAHFRQLVIVGHSERQKTIFAQVHWAYPTSPY